MNTTTYAAADAWADVEAALLTHFYQPDLEAARCFYATMAAHDLKGQPVWPMSVAPPGCGKTELLNPMDGLPNVHLIDQITPNTLISGRAPEPGKPRGKEGLLERIGNNAVLLFPDFSTVLSMHRDRRKDIYSQLRRIYDGHLNRQFGIDGIVSEWRGRLTIGAAVTPAIDRHTSMFGELGERFLLIRWRRIGGVAAAITAMNQDHDAKNAAMKGAVQGLFAAMQTAPEPQLPSDIEEAIAAIAELIACGRTHVYREKGDEVDYEPQPEGATRLAQQFCQLAKGSARLDGRAEVNLDDLRLVHRVAFDTLPPQRARVIRAVLAGEAVEGVDLPRTSLRRVLEDLEMVGVLDGRNQIHPAMADTLPLTGLTMA